MSKLDLRSFQQEITERLAVARRSGTEAPRLCFVAGGERYALPLSEITEVSPLTGVRKIPGTAGWLLGLTNVRGAVIALTHLGALLHQRAPEFDNESRVLVLGGNYARLRAGFLVNQIVGLRAMADVADTLGARKPWAQRTAKDPQNVDWALLDLAAMFRESPFLEIASATS